MPHSDSALRTRQGFKSSASILDDFVIGGDCATFLLTVPLASREHVFRLEAIAELATAFVSRFLGRAFDVGMWLGYADSGIIHSSQASTRNSSLDRGWQGLCLRRSKVARFGEPSSGSEVISIPVTPNPTK